MKSFLKLTFLFITDSSTQAQRISQEHSKPSKSTIKLVSALMSTDEYSAKSAYGVMSAQSTKGQCSLMHMNIVVLWLHNKQCSCPLLSAYG